MIKDVKKHDGEVVEICGFVKQVRDKKTMQFLVVRDVSESVQITIEKNDRNAEINKIVSALTVESSVKITGKVVETGLTSEGSRYVIIGNAYAGDIKLRGKVVAYLSDTAGDYCGRGYLATFNANLEKQNFFAFGEINNNAVRGVKYSCSVSEGFTAQYRFSLLGTVAEAMERALFDNLAPNTAGVCFAMLTGNTQSISADTLTAFRNGGIAHIFAVSGLHIGVIYGALTFIFKIGRAHV